jgi:perosamine synthetase
MKIPLFKIYWDNDDVKAVTSSVKRGMNWAAGPNIEKFEKLISKYIGRKYVAVFNSGTSALHSLLIALKINKEDEVIVPSFSFIATANAVLMTGAKPVFADIEETTYGLDVKDVERKITGKTKAIMPMHYGGVVAKDIKKLKDLAEKHNLLLIEDAAESFGAKLDNQKAGTFGEAAMFSFCQTKVFTTGEGGCIVTDSKDIYEKLKIIRAHGRAETSDYFTPLEDIKQGKNNKANPISESVKKNKTLNPLTGFTSGEYRNYVSLGYNFRMADIIAALGISQLKKADKLIKIRRKMASYMKDALASMKLDDIIIPDFPSNIFHVYQEFWLRCKSGERTRDELRKFLLKKGIGTRISFKPIHKTHFYKNILGYSDKLENTEKISQQALTLPLYPALTKKEVKYIAESIKKFYGSQ